MDIKSLREKMADAGVGAYVVTHGNHFLGQDILQCENKLQKLTGFSGSSGILLITKDEAFLLVDGRYELQAREETDAKLITVVDALPRLKNICDILIDKNIGAVGYNAWWHSVAEMEFIRRKYDKINFKDVGDWLGLADEHSVEILNRGVEFAGKCTAEKITEVVAEIERRNADYYLLTSADSVSWLLNIYARDLPYSPVVRTWAAVDREGKVKLYGDNLHQECDVSGCRDLAAFLQNAADRKILYDPHTTPEALKATSSARMIKTNDVCQMLKAQKNSVELQGMINCHIRDGVAVSKLLYWLEGNYENKSELDVVDKLHQLRSEQQYFFSESFATIAAYGGNGAIVHYQPNRKTNAELRQNGILLIDSGGQYLDGTTDITRTVILGEPTDEMKHDFTTVLKAHIALASACFPEDTSGIKLDVLARSHLWQNGDDYKHGTGHGVACFGNVHEGPISISSGGSELGFKENIVVSNEPGVYRQNRYGIRIENLQYTAKADGKDGFLEFKYLTKVPIDKRLINKYMLNNRELAWLNEYHREVYASLAAFMDEPEKAWLKDACSPL